MDRKKTRLALILLALAISAFVVWQVLPGNGGGTASVDPEQDASGGGDGGFRDPHPRRASNGGAQLKPRAPVELPDPMPKRDVGPPLEDGTSVPVRLTYKVGTKSEYVLTEATLTRNREDGGTVAERRYIGFSMRVVGASPEPRIQVSMDWMRIQAIYPNGLEFDFDTRDPDQQMLDDDVVGPTVKPLMAALGMPVQVKLGKNGAPVSIDGLDRLEEEWAAAVELISPGQTRKMEPQFALDDMLTQWMERFFPPVGADPIPAGEKRDMRLRRVTPYAHYVVFDGGLTSTHDADNVFRIAAVANVDKEPRLGIRRGHATAIERVHVQADADAYSAAWRFDREAGRLIDSEIDVKYQIWPSWRRGVGPDGGAAFEPRFLDVERSTRVELVDE